MRVTPTPAATRARMVYESGASCTTRGSNPAASHASTVASRTVDPALAGNETNGSPARSPSGTLSRAARGWSEGSAQISSSSTITR